MSQWKNALVQTSLLLDDAAPGSSSPVLPPQAQAKASFSAFLWPQQTWPGPHPNLGPWYFELAPHHTTPQPISMALLICMINAGYRTELFLRLNFCYQQVHPKQACLEEVHGTWGVNPMLCTLMWEYHHWIYSCVNMLRMTWCC